MPKVDIKSLFEYFRSLAKIDEFKNNIEIEKPVLSNAESRIADAISENLIRKIAERRDEELQKIERMIR